MEGREVSDEASRVGRALSCGQGFVEFNDLGCYPEDMEMFPSSSIKKHINVLKKSHCSQRVENREAGRPHEKNK